MIYADELIPRVSPSSSFFRVLRSAISLSCLRSIAFEIFSPFRNIHCTIISYSALSARVFYLKSTRERKNDSKFSISAVRSLSTVINLEGWFLKIQKLAISCIKLYRTWLFICSVTWTLPCIIQLLENFNKSQIINFFLRIYDLKSGRETRPYSIDKEVH